MESALRRRLAVLAVIAAFCAALLTGGAAVASPAGSGGWRHALEVPGTGPLNVGGNASVAAISCTSAGTCTAGGSYGSDPTDSSVGRAFLVSERHGRWATALQLPGIHNLFTLSSEILTVSCSSAGNCSAGGDYVDFSADQQAMLISERNGHWNKAMEVPGTAAVNNGNAAVTSISCPADGYCTAGGYYFGRYWAQSFLITERNGRWGKARGVTGLGSKAGVRQSRIYSVSCPAPGDCAAGGYYAGTNGRLQAFVVSERHGRWGRALEVPGMATLNLGGDGQVSSVSCSSAGNCAAGGYYESTKFNENTQIAHWQAFVVSEHHGVWGQMIGVLKVASVNDNTPGAATESVSCSAGGQCSAGGGYLDSHHRLQAFVVSEQGGRWGSAAQVPGLARLDQGGGAQVFSVSCAAAGACSAGGSYLGPDHHGQAFAVSERTGTWGTALEVPGTGALNTDSNAAVSAVSCTAAGQCGAGGFYAAAGHRVEAFVVSQG